MELCLKPLTCNLVDGGSLPGWNMQASIFASPSATQLYQSLSQWDLRGLEGAVEQVSQETIETDQAEDDSDPDVKAIRQGPQCI